MQGEKKYSVDCVLIPDDHFATIIDPFQEFCRKLRIQENKKIAFNFLSRYLIPNFFEK
mgnify:CR=1 FL=1